MKYYGMAFQDKTDRDILLNQTTWRGLERERKVRVVIHEMLHVLGWEHEDFFPNLMSSSLNSSNLNPYLDQDEQKKWRNLIVELSDEDEFIRLMEKAYNRTSKKKCGWEYHHGIKDKKQLRFYWD